MFFFLLKYSIPLHPVCFFLSDTRALYESSCRETVPKMNNQSLKNACFQSPAYFQKSKAYFLKSKAYFFESKPSFFPALFIPKMNSAIIPARFRRNRSSVFWGLSAMPLPSSPCHPAGRPVSQKKHGTHIMCAYAYARDEPPCDPP